MKNNIYETTIGSIVTSVGLLSGKSEDKNKALYSELKKDKKLKKLRDVKSIVSYIWEIWGSPELKPNLRSMVCVYDTKGLRSPMVTYILDNAIIPISPTGEYTGILRSYGVSPTVDIGYLFTDEEAQ